MRVVSLVPSLTETLLEAGAEVVGRTRYCVHPTEAKQLPVVGGTKDLDWDKFKALKPDLLVLDQEENLPWMKEQCPCDVHVFHATGLRVMPEETRKLAANFNGAVQASLLEMTMRWEKVLAASPVPWNWQKVPAEKNRRGPERNFEQVLYLIWKNPWMSVSRETFIGSVLEKLGAPQPVFSKLYPEIELSNFDPEKTLLLLSSEPFPFEKKWQELEELPHTQALIDGEPYSWFGIRSLRFLEKELQV